MQNIPQNYKRIDLLADDYKNKTKYHKLNEQAMCGQSERTQIVSLLSRIPTEFMT